MRLLKTLRIVHVITRLLRAGSEENVIATCLGQADRGHEVTLVYGRDHDAGYGAKLGSRIRLECVESLVQPIDLAADLRATREMTRLFRAIRPDVVHTHQSKAGVLGRIAARCAGVPHIVHGVHIAPFVNVGRLERAVYLTAERLAARVTHAFISVSGGMRDAYLDAGIGAPAKHHVVYSGMPLDAFIGATPPENWREIVGVGDGEPKPPILLMLAALESRKRHRGLIEVFGRVVERFPEVRLLCAGEGPDRADVEAAIADAGLEKNVRLLGFHSEPGRLVALADLCLLTSMREGLPRVVVQYIAGGKPVVVTRVPGIEEVVEDGVSGFVTDPDDLSDTAEAIIRLLSDEPLRARLAAGAAATDVSAWRPEALVEGTEKVYAELVSAA
ncbi:glycosyltransferase [Pikeienuella sp. HZG-20]|uniref:glycosyltransferase n=1 Tax=Paludibacillus litoralis TaxID=3133267 RepID=UPI0030EDEE3B